MKPKAKKCFEVSWEVCNKVGGIYTVVSSKAQQMITQYGKENYCLIGPYFPKKAYGIFEEKAPPNGIKDVFDKLRQEGIDCHWGNWTIKGEPCTLLIEFSNFTKNKDAIKKELWDKYQVDSLGTEYFDFDEPIIWSYAAGRVIEELSKKFNEPAVAHFHEWLAGAGLLYLKIKNAKVGTAFTTHATMLGRTIASRDEDLYNMLGKFDPAQRAKELGVNSKYTMEKACAHNAGAFTTVSEITGIEAEHLLGKKPDVLLLNGLDISKFPTFEETSVKHKLFKTKIRDFLLYYFFPYYAFDLHNTLFFFLAGRHEYHDKGIDTFINALGMLNERLKKEKSKRSIVALFFVPGNIKGIKPHLLMSRTLFMDIHDSVEDNINHVEHEILHTLIEKKDLNMQRLFGEEFMQIKRKVMRFTKEGNPPLSTHDLYEDDDIINGFKKAGLTNTKENKVKVVYYPIYLTGADGLLDTNYYESMMGCHLGVFPSYYEPWGYTPLEAGALGVASATTDLAGFGRYICKECETKKNPGIFVLKRMGVKDQETEKELAEHMYYFLNLTKQERVANKIAARHVAEEADWKEFIKNYVKAHNIAMDKVQK